MIHEEDRSHTLPFPLPDDRPLTYAEQLHIWRGGMWEASRRKTDPMVPDALRLGPVLERHQFKSEAEFKEAARLEAAMETSTRDRLGWLINRLEWDAQFPARNLDGYEVPSCCRPGAKRESRKALMWLRNSMYPAPHFAKPADVEARLKARFAPPYEQASTPDGGMGW